MHSKSVLLPNCSSALGKFAFLGRGPLLLLLAVPFAQCWMACAQVAPPSDPICRLRTSGGVSVTGPLEYDVKAAILYRCLELVHWPSTSKLATDLKVGILGKNLFGESLKPLVGKVVSGRKLVVKKVSGVKTAKTCDVLFICSSEEKQTPKILKDLAGLSIVTVGESTGFADEGGVMNLLVDGKNIRLELNLGAAERARLTIDQQLLKALPLVSDVAPATKSGSEP